MTTKQFIIIGTRQQLMNVNISYITIGDSETPVKNLGAWLDETLSMNSHITKATSAAFYHLYNLRLIRKYLTKRTTEILIHAYIHPADLTIKTASFMDCQKFKLRSYKEYRMRQPGWSIRSHDLVTYRHYCAVCTGYQSNTE